MSKNALSRFETSLRKLYGNKIDAIDDFEVDAAEDVHAWIQEADAKDAEDAARAAQADEYQEAEQVRPKARRKTAPKKRAP